MIASKHKKKKERAMGGKKEMVGSVGKREDKGNRSNGDDIKYIKSLKIPKNP